MSDIQTLSHTTLAIALEELAQGAGEKGGNNLGPWVKKYMGKEGLPWCVGFATWCYREACQHLGVTPVLKERWSSSRLVKEANRLGIFLNSHDATRPSLASSKAEITEQTALAPGHFFVVRGGPTGYRHTGIVRNIHWDASGRLASITTVEGNVRPDGGGKLDRVLNRTRQRGLVFVTY